MLFQGRWSVCEDGVTRPLFRALAETADGAWEPVDFLVDTGADRTTFIAPVALQLGLSAVGSRDQLTGLGGTTPSVQVSTSLRFRAESGQYIRFVSHFMALTDPKVMDMSVLGRDILNVFTLIVDHQQQRVCLLGDGHRYVIEER
jgi:hypothetical protein